MSASRGASSRHGANRMSHLSGGSDQNTAAAATNELPSMKNRAGSSQAFGQKRKSAEALAEKYSPIKEAAKHKEEHSLEERSDDDDEDYTSADASESTMKYKYSNANVTAN